MKKDVYLKILFAIELALLPLTIFAKIYMPSWAISVFVAIILICKIFRELFKDKQEKSNLIICSIANIATALTLLILFMNLGYLSKLVGIITIIAIVTEIACEYIMFYNTLPEFVESVAYCNIMFQCLVLLAMTFAYANSTILTVACIACTLTSAVFIVYTVVYLVKNMPKKSR